MAAQQFWEAHGSSFKLTFKVHLPWDPGVQTKACFLHSFVCNRPKPDLSLVCPSLGDPERGAAVGGEAEPP